MSEKEVKLETTSTVQRIIQTWFKNYQIRDEREIEKIVLSICMEYQLKDILLRASKHFCKKAYRENETLYIDLALEYSDSLRQIYV